MPFSLLLFTGAVAGVSLLLLPWCAVGEDDDTYIEDVDDSYDSDAWYTDYSDEDDDDEGGDNEDGLTPDELQMLPWFTYCGGGGDRWCGICLEEMRDGERCRRPGRCRHAFHAACVDEWLTTRRTCPCCRELVLVPPAAAGCSHVSIADVTKLFGINKY